jgi:hypothetical protein
LSCRWGDYFVRLVVWTPPARSIQWAFGYDAFASGDRNGFQDLIGEAQSHSLPFFLTDVSGTTEGVKDGVTGDLLDLDHLPAVASLVCLSM